MVTLQRAFAMAETCFCPAKLQNFLDEDGTRQKICKEPPVNELSEYIFFLILHNVCSPNGNVKSVATKLA
jgi:hypothetical protein